MSFKAVCVFCGSQSGVRAEYQEAARELAQVLARRSVTVVYGGGHVGMMGTLADETLARDGHIVGIIPRHLMRPEVAHRGLTELHVVESMHERKQAMARRSDAFIVLPGGYGTLEEMFEMVTWLQLQLQTKPVGILNIEGYFDRMLDFLRHAAQEGFIHPEHWDLLIVEHTSDLLLDRLALHAQQMNRSHPARVNPRRG